MATGGQGSGRPDQPAAPPSHPLDERYYVRGETEAYGPYDGRALKDMIEQGRLSPTTGIARLGETQWSEVKDHRYFGSLRPAGSSAPPGEAIRLPGAPGYAGGVVPAQLRYAGFWIRFVAYLIDAVLLWILCTVIGGVIGAVIGASLKGGSLDASSTSNDTVASVAGGLAVLAMFAAAIVYNVLFVSGSWQATPGKRLLGLHIITASGQRVGGWRAFGRYLCYIVSALPFYIGFMMIGWNKEKKGIHDMICETRVVYGKL
ncbi:MAG: RDD family protein [Beijerinckiaceae bacterium]